MVPLYSVLMQEVDPEDLTHLEADTFWLLEAMVAEFSGLEDEGGNIWMKVFSKRVAWADFDLSTDLVTIPAQFIWENKLISYFRKEGV